MTALNSSYKDRHFLAVIGDEVQTLPPSPFHLIAYCNVGLRDRFAAGWNRGMTWHASKIWNLSSNFTETACYTAA